MTGNEARYDEYAKRLLSEKIVLAYILVKVVDEFRGMKPQDVVPYIEGEVVIGKVPIKPGFTNARIEIQENTDTLTEEYDFSTEELDWLEKMDLSETESIDLREEPNPSEVEVVSSKGSRVVGLNTIYQELNEGENIFDIIFYVRTKNGISKIIINIEIQKDEPTKYYILNRVVFYVSRMISSEKQRDFIHSNYNDMKEVYSIWLCTGEKENTLNNIQLSDENLIGLKKWKGNLNLFNAVIIGLSDKLPEYDETYDLHRLLGVILSDHLSYRERIEIIEKDYKLELPDELKREVETMYSLGAEIRKKGVEEGVRLMSANLLKTGMPISQIAQIAEVSVEKLQSWFQEQTEHNYNDVAEKDGNVT